MVNKFAVSGVRKENAIRSTKLRLASSDLILAWASSLTRSANSMKEVKALRYHEINALKG